MIVLGSRFREVLAKQAFAVTVELNPPKGTNLTRLLEVAKGLVGHVHGVNVTDNTAAVMRVSSIAVCRHLYEQGHDPIMQMTCRDRNRLAIQSDLLGASTLGIRNVLCLTGDPPHVGDHKDAKGVYDLDSVHMMQTITYLNQGRDLAGKPLDGATDFFIGGAVAPEADPPDVMHQKFAAKIKAGAEFFQTQAVFLPDVFKGFMSEVHRYHKKILAGILVLRSHAMAVHIQAHIPGIHIPADILVELQKAGPSHELEAGVEIAVRLIKAVRPHCDGVHIMAARAVDWLPVILRKAELVS